MAKGAGLMGEAGPEAVIPLVRGSNGRLGVGSSGGGMSVQIIDQRGAHAPAVDVQTTQGADGMKQLRIMLHAEVQSAFAGGRFDGAMRQNYGIRRSAGGR